MQTAATIPLSARHPAFGMLALGALGVVYGDIGTSPLYALQVAFASENNVAVTRANVLGILSLFFWSLIIVVTIKYVLYVMRANNDGEGGIMALMALALRRATGTRERRVVIILGLLGVALFYGDGVITPAISVLSAVEGTSVATSSLARFEVPITLVIMTLLFLYERRGTEKIGRLFGPIMMVWFVAIAALGIRGIVQNPGIFQALDPYWAGDFFFRQPFIAFVALGAVVLCITGTEALYADMGHFGRWPIATAWVGLVLPALVLNYFGQGAEILKNPKLIDNPFFHMAPSSLTLVLVVLATVATIIASQAVISGAYSMTQQAIQLDYLPRMSIRHTSAQVKGQIYVPGVNWVLYVIICALVVGFGSSTKLASAYGIAVTGTMATTTVIAYTVTRHVFHWSRLRAVLVTVPLLVIDVVYFGANALKFIHGGWFPILFGSGIFVLMVTWNQGRGRIRDRIAQEGVALAPFMQELEQSAPGVRIPGTAVFMTASATTVPRALLSNLKHNVLLHEQVVFVHVKTLDTPRLAPDERVSVEHLGNGFWRVTLRCGFLDEPDVPQALRRCNEHGLALDPDNASYFVGRDAIVTTPGRPLKTWRRHVFAAMHRNAGTSVDYFRLPPDRVLEVGSQIVL